MGNGDTMGSLPVAILAAVLAGGTGSAAYQTIVPPRPDPFSGSDAKDLAAELRREHVQMRQEWSGRSDRVEHRIDELQQRMDLRFDRLQNLIMERSK